MKTRYWFAYLLPLEYQFISQALTALGDVKYKAGKEEYWQGVPQKAYRFTRKRDAERFTRLIQMYRRDWVMERQRVEVSK